MASRIPSLFICHGGGPMPVLGDPSMAPAVTHWKKYVASYFSGEKAPKAIVVVSAHYETDRVVKVSSGANPGMLYDYGGFPQEAYSLKYPAPGNPELADKIVSLLSSKGIAAQLDPARKYDHGVFVPLMLMFPKADIPVVAMSVLRSQGAKEHVAIGRAIESLREEGVLILGSGSSSHNFRYIGRGKDVGLRFNDMLSQIIQDPTMEADERTEALGDFLNFPGAEEAQTAGAAEHLMPAFTVLGTAGGNLKGKEVGNYNMMTWNERDYLFV